MFKIKNDIIFIISQVLFILLLVALVTNQESEVNSENFEKHKTHDDRPQGLIDSLIKSNFEPIIIYSLPEKDALEWVNVPFNINTIMASDNKNIIKIENIITESMPLTKFSYNTVINTNSESLKIYVENNLILSIPPNGKGIYQLNNENSIRYAVGKKNTYFKPLTKKRPILEIRELESGSPNASLSELNRLTRFQVIISNEFPQDLEVTFNGPIIINEEGVDGEGGYSNQLKRVLRKRNGVYNILLRQSMTKKQFDEFTVNKSKPYTISFTVTIKDIVDGYTVSKTGTFTFGKL